MPCTASGQTAHALHHARVSSQRQNLPSGRSPLRVAREPEGSGWAPSDNCYAHSSLTAGGGSASSESFRHGMGWPPPGQKPRPPLPLLLSTEAVRSAVTRMSRKTSAAQAAVYERVAHPGWVQSLATRGICSAVRVRCRHAWS
jgi:hypothetical protein